MTDQQVILGMLDRMNSRRPPPEASITEEVTEASITEKSVGRKEGTVEIEVEDGGYPGFIAVFVFDTCGNLVEICAYE